MFPNQDVGNDFPESQAIQSAETPATMTTHTSEEDDVPLRMRRHILIVGGGSDLQPRLRSTTGGVRTSVICRTSVLPWVYQLEENAAVLALPEDVPVERWVALSRALHAIDPFDGVTSLTETDQDKAAAIAEAIGLSYHSRATISWVHNKFLMRQRLSECGVEDIPNALALTPDDVLACGTAWGYPLILKPSRGRGSMGISVVESPADIPTLFARSTSASAPRVESSLLIVEPFLTGKEISIEALADDGVIIPVAIVEKYKDSQTKVELGHVVPANLDPTLEEQICGHLRRVFEALQIRVGISHTEMILTANGPRIVETHVRRAGDEIPTLIYDAFGIDIIEYMLEQVAGLPIAARLKAHLAKACQSPKAAAIWFTHVDARGELLEVQGVEEAKANPGVQELHLLLKPGSQLNGLMSSHSRVTSIRTVADSKEEALCRAQEASKRLSFDLRVTDRGLLPGVVSS